MLMSDTGGGTDVSGLNLTFRDGAAQTLPPSQLASGQTAAGARSTYLICQAQMGGAAGAGSTYFYGANNTTLPTATCSTPGSAVIRSRRSR